MQMVGSHNVCKSIVKWQRSASYPGRRITKSRPLRQRYYAPQGILGADAQSTRTIDKSNNGERGEPFAVGES